MDSSSYLLQSLMFEMDSASSEYYARSEALLFQSDDKPSIITMHSQSREDISGYGEAKQSTDRVDCKAEDKDNCERFALQHVKIDLEKLQHLAKNTKHDFRVFYIGQRNSYSELKIKKEHFEELLIACHVFPKVRNYIIGFGSRQREPEIGPPAITFRPLTEKGACGFESTYILRYIEFTNRDKIRPWSLRQYAVYHKYVRSGEEPCSTWILFGQWQRARTIIEDHAADGHDIKQENPFEMHMAFIDVALASWRPYLIDLHDKVYDIATDVDHASIDDKANSSIKVSMREDRMLKGLEDNTTDALVCLHATMNTLSTISTMYRHLFPPAAQLDGHGDILSIMIGEKQRETTYFCQRAEGLMAKIKSTRTMLSLLLKQRDGYNLQTQIKALQILGTEAKKENEVTRDLALGN
ncbi:hypothetical protein DM02DRAFT_695242 [Periconia macrospinosa]|uniref:CorA-like transporter domain-containing protein n=1 Tax=Periconia macrospinosa TaxID=97972 RepID=A0A2V1D6J5_9PLEO|nr:hypothetical protein DM02DRAFT_695242 [Periconia macrospinosa]